MQRNEKHGDRRRALDSINRQIDALNKLIKELEKQPGTSRIIQQLIQKIKNLQKEGNRKKKGEEHSRGPKR
ncbi:MAG: hypothetical protein LBE13_15405 [Bacteroidales bacterium]|nr:hypothetical protein [Bacteroidales bacterium]